MDLKSLTICQMSHGDRNRTRLDSAVCAISRVKPFSYSGTNHCAADCFSGAKTGEDAEKDQLVQTYTTLSTVGNLSASFPDDVFQDSSFQMSDIFTCLCFYCAIFEGLSVFRKKKKEKMLLLPTVMFPFMQNVFLSLFECGVM